MATFSRDIRDETVRENESLSSTRKSSRHVRHVDNDDDDDDDDESSVVPLRRFAMIYKLRDKSHLRVEWGPVVTHQRRNEKKRLHRRAAVIVAAARASTITIIYAGGVSTLTFNVPPPPRHKRSDRGSARQREGIMTPPAINSRWRDEPAPIMRVVFIIWQLILIALRI